MSKEDSFEIKSYIGGKLMLYDRLSSIKELFFFQNLFYSIIDKSKQQYCITEFFRQIIIFTIPL